MAPKAVSQLRVADVMTRNPVCVSLGTTARELAEILEANDISGVPVLDVQERVVGVVSKTDLIHRALEAPLDGGRGSFFAALAEGLGTSGGDLDPDSLGTVDEFMSTDPVTATADESIGRVARRMAEQGVHRVPVVDGRARAIGILTTLDLLRVFPT
jgi:CBS domain-containing protein